MEETLKRLRAAVDELCNRVEGLRAGRITDRYILLGYCREVVELVGQVAGVVINSRKYPETVPKSKAFFLKGGGASGEG